MSDPLSFSDFRMIRNVNVATLVLLVGADVYSVTKQHQWGWPGDYSHYIWSLIALYSAGYVAYGFTADEHHPDIVKTIGYRFALLCVLSSVFSLTLSAGVLVAPVIVAAEMLALALAIDHALARQQLKPASPLQIALVHAPFGVWLAWSVVALSLALVLSFGADPAHRGLYDGYEVDIWLLLLAIASLVVAFVGGRTRRGDVAATATLAWWLTTTWVGIVTVPGARAGDKGAASAAAAVSWLATAKAAYFTWVLNSREQRGQARLDDDERERAPLLGEA